MYNCLNDTDTNFVLFQTMSFTEGMSCTVCLNKVTGLTAYMNVGSSLSLSEKKFRRLMTKSAPITRMLSNQN